MRSRPWSALLLSLALALVAPRPGLAESPFDPRLPFETAIIHVEFGGIASGDATIWIDGDRMARHEKRTTTVMGMSQTQEQWTISTPEEMLVWEVGEPTAIRSENPAKRMREEYRKLSAAEQEVVARNSKKMGNVFMAGLGGGKTTSGTFLGYDVDIVEVMGSKQYMLKGTPLLVKQEGGMAGMKMSETATKIEADVAVPQDKFRLPPEVKVVPNPAGDMATNIAMSTFESLKDPNFEEKMAAGGAPATKGRATPAGMPGMPSGQGMPDAKELQKAMEQMMKAMQKAGAGGPPK